MALDAEHDLRCPGRAHVSRRHGVRISAQDLDLDIGHAVRPRGVHAAVHRVQRRERAVRAATEHERGLARDDPPVRGHAGTQRDDRGMPRISGQQLLGVGHDHLDRPARGRGQMIGGHAVHERALAAEVAADGGGVHADPHFVHADRRGELAARDERRLVGNPQVDLPVRLDPNHAGVRLDVALVDPRNAERVGELARGLGKAGIHVAVRIDDARHHVGNVREQLVVARMREIGNRRVAVAARIRVDARGVVAHGVERVEHRGQLVVFHVDARQRLFGHVHRLRGDRHHLLAHEADHVAGQYRHVEKEAADAPVGQVGPREHRVHARQGRGLCGVDGYDPRVRKRAAQAFAVQQSGQGDVRGIAGRAGDLGRPFHVARGLPDADELRHSPSRRGAHHRKWSVTSVRG